MSIEIKGVIIGEGKPKVCVPIVESHDEAILNKLKEFNELEVDMIELRYSSRRCIKKFIFKHCCLTNTKTSYSNNSYSCRRWRS